MTTLSHTDCKDAETAHERFDVFVVCDEESDIVKNTILPFLRDEKATYCELQENGVPGVPYRKSARQLLRKSRKTLIVTSAKSNRVLKSVIHVVIEYNYDSPENVITLITEVNVKSDKFLEQTISVHMASENWKEELLKEIYMTIPEYCRLLGTGKVTDRQFQMGLCLQHFKFEMYGLMISANEKFLKVDLDDYCLHADIHHKYKTTEVCGQCEILCDIDTKISIILNENFRIDDCSEEIRKDFINLALGVIDIATATREQIKQMIFCSTTGVFGLDQNIFLAEMYSKLQYAVNNKRVGYTSQPFCPEYTDVEKRKESFVGFWNEKAAPSIDSMAKAGFLFYDKPDASICFSCSFIKFGWDVNDDPVDTHLAYINRCDHMMSLVSAKKMSDTRPNIHHKINKEYISIDDRLKSLEGLNFSKMKTPGGSVVDCCSVRSDLSAAGFFFTGFDVMVKCFTCGLIVLFNDTKVIPWVLHAVLSPYCPFVVEQKGLDFVKETQCTREMVGCGKRRSPSCTNPSIRGMFHRSGRVTCSVQCCLQTTEAVGNFMLSYEMTTMYNNLNKSNGQSSVQGLGNL